MKVAKWGNSLAVRLPRAIVDELALREGDEVTIRPGVGGGLEIERERSRAEALERIKALSRPLPDGYRFDRDEIYDRFGPDSPGRKPYDD